MDDIILVILRNLVEVYFGLISLCGIQSANLFVKTSNGDSGIRDGIAFSFIYQGWVGSPLSLLGSLIACGFLGQMLFGMFALLGLLLWITVLILLARHGRKGLFGLPLFFQWFYRAGPFVIFMVKIGADNACS